MAIEKVERFETPESETAGSTVSVVVQPNEPREYLGSWNDTEITDADLVNLKNSWVGTKAVLQDWREKEAAVAKDARFTEAGRADALAKELVAFEKRLAPYEEVLKFHSERANEMERNLLTLVIPNVAEHTAPQEIRSGEIRKHFLSLPRGGTGGQIEFLTNCLQENDAEALEAILNAPKSLKILAREIREHVLERMLENADPDAVAGMRQRQKAVETARFALDRVKSLLRGKMPLPPRERFIRSGTN